MRWLVLAGVVLPAVGVIAVGRIRAAMRRHALAAQRPTRAYGPDGVVAGAESLALDGSGERAALILHGFNDTPQSVRGLAAAIHARGWTVRAPLLSHHGRSFDEFAKDGRAEAWIADARREWNGIRQRHAHAVLVGQSMGGAIAAILAAEAPPAALVLLAPYLVMGRAARLLSSIWPLWQVVTPFLFSDPRRGLRDASARAHSLGHGVFTPRLVRELRRVVDEASTALPRIAAPTLVLHARSDYRIPSASAVRGFERLGAQTKELMWRANAGHVLAADLGKEEVFSIVTAWLERHTASATP